MPRPHGKTVRILGALAGAGLSWGLFEAQWVERHRLELPVRGLPPALDGFRILHLSDLHLGSLSLNGRALASTVEWARREADLVAVTGDLLARQRGERELHRALHELRPSYGAFVVLGNVDRAVTRDPFSGRATIRDVGPDGVLLEDEAVVLEVEGCRVQLVGCAVASRSRPPIGLADPAADLRILLAHFPDIVDRVPQGAFQLVLSGHFHGGQICLPYPGGKVRFADFRPPYPEGVFELRQTTLVVSRGLGTTFVPFRFCARPEAALLTLRQPA